MIPLLQDCKNSSVRSAYLLLGTALVLLFLFEIEASWARSDAIKYHMAYVEKVSQYGFLEAIRNPGAAMPPFYHTVVSILHTSFNLPPYLAGKIVSLNSTLVLLHLCAAESKPSGYFAPVKWPLFFTLAFSWPLLSATLSPVTDSFAVLLYIAITLCILKERYLPMTILLPAIVLTRQYYLAIVAALLVAMPLRFVLKDYVGRSLTLVGPNFYLVISLFLALVSSLFLYLSWGEMVPSEYRSSFKSAQIVNLGPIALSLAYAGSVVILNIAFNSCRIKLSSYLIGLPIGVAMYFLLPTDYSIEGGRWGSIFWRTSIIKHSLGFNPFFLIPIWIVSSFAIEQIGYHWKNGANHQSALFLLAVFGLTGIFSLQPFSWQRYVDPMIGIAVTAYLASLIHAQRERSE